jgi:type IV secretion system protein VirB9
MDTFNRVQTPTGPTQRVAEHMISTVGWLVIPNRPPVLVILGVYVWLAWVATYPARLAAANVTSTANVEEPSHARIAEWIYDPNRVFSLNIPVGGHIHLGLEEGERYVNIGAGDTAAIDVGAEGAQVVIKAKEAVEHTNLTLITDKRVYIFDYTAYQKSHHKNSSTTAFEPIYSVHFKYPNQSSVKPSVASTITDNTQKDIPRAMTMGVQANSPEVINTPTAEPASLVSAPFFSNKDYWFKGAEDLLPLEVVDNGLQTRVLFKPNTPLPSVYIIEGDGSESLTNLHVEDDHLVLHRVASRWVLKRGRLTAEIVNRSFNNYGQRTHLGTVDPNVERVIREPAP